MTIYKSIFTLGVLLSVLVMAGGAYAGDYFNECQTEDPRFEINDDTLYAKSAPTIPISFEIIEKFTTSERRGYCVSKGQKFPFEARNSTMRIRFYHDGSRIEMSAVCEYASSGLPAAYSCDREVVTMDTSNGETEGGTNGSNGGDSSVACGAGSVWNHNGSTMRLMANGANRTFAYERPRSGVVRAGVTSCDIVFEGEKVGDEYIGTAYVFLRDCGPVGYPVSGPVTNGGLKVTLYGQAPRRRDDCSVSGYRDDKLVFEYLRSE